MRRVALMAVAIALAVPGAVRAASLAEVSMRAGVGYESNVFRTGTPVPDAVWLLAPTLKLTQSTPRLDLYVDYRPVAEIFQTESKADGVDQIVVFQSIYSWSPRTEMTLADTFGYVRNLRRLQVDDQPGELETSLARTTQNRAALSLQHTLSPRSSLSFSSSHRYRETDQENDVPINTVSSSGTYSYVLTRKDVVGFGASYIFSTFGDSVTPVRTIRDRASHSINAYLVWARTWNHKWRTSLRAGPAWVSFDGTIEQTFEGFVIDPGPPPMLVPFSTTVSQSIASTTLTYFANISATRTWSRGSASVNYQRTLSAQSATGVDSSVDAVFLNATWEPNVDWRATTRIGYNRRESVNLAAEAPTGITPVINQFSVLLNVTRRLTDRMNASMRFRYLNQQGQGAGANRRDTFDNFEINFGIKYEFRPWRS